MFLLLALTLALAKRHAARSSSHTLEETFALAPRRRRYFPSLHPRRRNVGKFFNTKNWWKTGKVASYIPKIMKLSMCGQGTVPQYLQYIIRKMRRYRIKPVKKLKSSMDIICSMVKGYIIPIIQNCVVKGNDLPAHTVYAGVTADVSLVLQGAMAAGAYIGSDGKEGCFFTTCHGVGANLGGGLGLVAGFLLGDTTNDLPGVAYGGAFGGDWGYGYDLAGGMTATKAPYVEVTKGVGAGVVFGYEHCTTTTKDIDTVTTTTKKPKRVDPRSRTWGSGYK